MAKATLGGKALLDGPIEWRLTPGVTPNQAEFEMERKDAESLVSGALSPVTLKLDGSTFEFLYVIQIVPADSPNTVMVRVVDRRWFWPYVAVDHSFNVRWAKGFRRVKQGFDRPEIDPVVVRQRYANWSTPTSGVWGAVTALKEVWKTVQLPEKEATGSAASFKIDPSISKLGEGPLPLEDVILSDGGDAAFKRILDFIPGAEITVDPDGTVRVYSKASGGEKKALDELLPEQVDGGHAELVEYGLQRPRETRIFFTVEPEIKFSFNEAETPNRYAAGAIASKPKFDNVLPIPDYSLGGIAQGTWYPIALALTDWGPIPNFGTLTLAVIRRAMVPYMDIFTGARIAGLAAQKADWGPRIGAVEQHFRRTYKIRPDFMQRLRSIRAYRVATIDRATGTRSPAVVFQNWSVVATQRSLSVAVAAGGERFAYATNYEKEPKDNDAITSDSRPAPASVSVVDHDQGVISIEFLPDKFRVHQQFLPSTIDNIPSGRLGSGGIAWNAMELGRKVPELSSKHRVNTILTVIPGGPNNKSRLFRLKRGPKDATKLLPTTLQGGLTSAKGPPLDIIVGPGWATALIAWADAEGSRILNGLGLGDDPKQIPKDGVNSLASLVVNLESRDVGAGTAASLDAIANAVNAAIYASYADRVGGSRTAPATHKAVVDGFIEEIITTLLPDGEASTTATVGEREAPLDLMSFMPVSTRAIILKLAQL